MNEGGNNVKDLGSGDTPLVRISVVKILAEQAMSLESRVEAAISFLPDPLKAKTIGVVSYFDRFKIGIDLRTNAPTRRSLIQKITDLMKEIGNAKDQIKHYDAVVKVLIEYMEELWTNAFNDNTHLPDYKKLLYQKPEQPASPSQE